MESNATSDNNKECKVKQILISKPHPAKQLLISNPPPVQELLIYKPHPVQELLISNLPPMKQIVNDDENEEEIEEGDEEESADESEEGYEKCIEKGNDDKNVDSKNLNEEGNDDEKGKNEESEGIIEINQLEEIELDVSLHSEEEFPDETFNVKKSVVCNYKDPKESLTNTMNLKEEYNKNDLLKPSLLSLNKLVSTSMMMARKAFLSLQPAT